MQSNDGCYNTPVPALMMLTYVTLKPWLLILHYFAEWKWQFHI